MREQVDNWYKLGSLALSSPLAAPSEDGSLRLAVETDVVLQSSVDESPEYVEVKALWCLLLGPFENLSVSTLMVQTQLAKVQPKLKNIIESSLIVQCFPN